MIIVPNRDFPYLDSRGIPTPEFYGWVMAVSSRAMELEKRLDLLTLRVQELESQPPIFTGSGTPNIEAPLGAIYTEQSTPAVFVKTGATDTDWDQA